MDRLIVFAARHPLPLVLMIALLTVAAALRLDELRFELSAEGMMVAGDPARDFYRHTLDTFGIEGLLLRRLPLGGFLAVCLLRPHDQ